MQIYSTAKLHAELQKGLGDLLSKSGGVAALLVDESGVILARRGKLPDGDEAELGILLACNYLVTQEMADLLGREELSSLAQEGDKASFFIRRAGPRSLLVILYADPGALGRVRLFADNAALAMAPVLKVLEIGRFPPETLPAGFNEAVQASMAQLLNN